MQTYNFGSGPGMLPTEVLETARGHLDVMELAHRSQAFLDILQQAETELRQLLSIPNHYRVLFLQGGASLQFAMAPLNLLGDKTQADYLNTGYWSQKAITEAQRFCQVNVVAQGKHHVPEFDQWQLGANSAYLHITPNETIAGVEFTWIPKTAAPLVADMSSYLLSQPLEVERFGLIYCGAQKNLGIAGLTVVIIRDDLLDRARSDIPSLLQYRTHVEHHSMANTPPTWAIYLTSLMTSWLLSQGGLAAMAEQNRQKAALIYAAIDHSGGFYENPVALKNRSRVNIPFFIKDRSLEPLFLEQAQARGLTQLKGHRSAGGIRASVYNAMPVEGAAALATFMKDFVSRFG
jgi:phosphoserine aminotransferase